MKLAKSLLIGTGSVVLAGFILTLLAPDFGDGFRSALNAPRKRVAGLRSSRPQSQKTTG
jgi:hypothetical protein